MAPVTVTLNWQGVPGATIAPPRVMVVGEVVVSVPPHVGVGPEVATVSPVGSRSKTPTPSRDTVLTNGLVIVKVRGVVPPTGMEPPNTLLITGGARTMTVSGPQVLLLSLNSIMSWLGSR